MKDIKMLLLDMDDTLLNSGKKITSRTREAITNASAKGVLIGYVTARSPRTVPGILDGLPIDAVSYYGGVRTFCEDKLVSNLSLTNGGGQRLIRAFREQKPNGYINIYSEPYSIRYNSLYKNWEEHDGDIDGILEGSDIQRIIIRTSDLPLVKGYITNRMRTVDTRHGDTIITHRDADKGNAARAISSYYCIGPDNMAVFGDDLSDFPMFRYCGTGIAMGNALYEIKSEAAYVTRSMDEDGVAIWLEKYLI